MHHSSTSVARHPEADTWDRFAATHPHAHILQTSPWGTLKAGFGWIDERIGLARDGALIAGAQVLYRRLPVGLGRLAYVPKGPMVDWAVDEEVTALIAALDQAAQSRGAIALSVEPDLPDETVHRERLRQLGFRPAPVSSVQPRRTIVVDISPDEEDILAAMKSKTRYNVRLAGRKGVAVRKAAPMGTKASEAAPLGMKGCEATETDLSTFQRLMDATSARNRFGVHAASYYDEAYRLFAPRNWARLLLAEVESEAVAAVMVFALPPRAWYFYGASSNVHREKMPTYLLQWEAMRWAKSQGCTSYDLWGIPDEEEETLEAEFTHRHDGLWGVYRFKRGFGGRLARSVGAWDRVYSPARYRLYRLVLWARNRLLNVRSSMLELGH